MRLLALLAASAACAATVPGEFRLSREGEAWRVELTRTDTLIDNRRVLHAPLDLGAEGSALRFRLSRAAGVFDFAGTVTASGAEGRFVFEPDAAFAMRLKEAGVRNWWEPGVAFEAAAGGRIPLSGPAFHPLPQAPLPDERTRALRVHGVTPEYERLLRQGGYDTFSSSALIELRSRGVRPVDLQELRMRGHRNLSVNEIVRLKNDGFAVRP